MIKKSDIKPGMLVARTNGNAIALDAPGDILLSGDAWGFLSDYDDNLIRNKDGWGYSEILAVYDYPTRTRGVDELRCYPALWHKLWDRKDEPQEMTLTQIEEALGHPVKIVKEVSE